MTDGIGVRAVTQPSGEPGEAAYGPGMLAAAAVANLFLSRRAQ